MSKNSNGPALPDLLNVCGGSMVKRMMRQLRDLPNLANRRDILLSTDCGADCDDQAVVAYLALSEQFRLVGIVSSFSPNVAAPHAITTFTNVHRVLDKLPLKKRPTVVAGSNHPLEEATAADVTGADFIIEVSEAYDARNRMTIVLIGPATDVAIALQRDPTLEDRIEVVAMAFDGPAGNDPYNVKNDVWSWQILLESETPITIGGGDVCLRHLLVNRNTAADLFRGEVGKHLSDYILDWTARNAHTVEKMSGKAGHWPIWDLVTVAYLLGYTHTTVLPRPVLQDDTTFSAPDLRPLPEGTREPHVRWVTRIDSDALWRDYVALLDEADHARD